MRRVFVCSAFRGDVARNAALARAVCRQIVLDCDAPFAPHLLYPALLDDAAPSERALGIEAGLAWLRAADEVLVVGSPTEGMLQEIAAAETLGIPVRRIAAPELPSIARRHTFGDALRCRLLHLWAEWSPLLALAIVVLGFLLCPGCVGSTSCRRGSCVPAPTAGAARHG